MADRKISDLTALTTPASGDYLPIVDISEASAANKNKRITIEELLRGAPDGTAGAPGIGFESDPNTGIYSPGADALGLVTAGTERARIDNPGRLLVGTSSATNNIRLGEKIATVAVGTSAYSGFSATSYVGAVNDGGAIIDLNRSRGATDGTMTSVASGDLLGRIHFRGSDGSAFQNAATIDAVVEGTPAAGKIASRLVFSVTADGASSPTEALRISNNRAITVSDGGNVVLGTTTGTKIGTATTQKLGFYNATPVVQPAAVADATDAATVITQLNDLLAKLRTLGIIAT